MFNLSKGDQKKAILAMGAAATLSALYYGFRKRRALVTPKSIYGEVHLSQAEASKRKQIIENDVHYEINLNLNKGTTFTGTVAISFVVKHHDSLTLNYSGKEILSICVNGVNLYGADSNFKHLWKDTYVHIPKTLLKVKNLNSIVIKFRNEYSRDGTGLHSFTDVDGSQYLYTSTEPFHLQKVMPIFDQPDIKGIMSLTVEAPEDWTIVSNEAPLDIETKVGRSKWIFSKTKPISTYLYCLCAGPWERVDWTDTYKGIPMAIYSTKALGQYLKKHSENLKEVTNKCMQFYEEFFNFPYPFHKYDQIFVPEMNMGAMEYPGAVTFTDKALYKDEVKVERICIRAMIVAHEMAHMWFGDLVTMKWWNDLWLNESFADFAAFTCLHSLEFSFETVNFMELWFSDQQWGFEQDKKPTTHPIATEVVNTLQAETNFDGITYAKGAATMKQLYFLMGKTKFCKALNQYFCKFAWGNASLFDFIDCLNIHFTPVNGYDLYKWKDEWICKAGINTLMPVWEFNPDSNQQTLTIMQSAYIDTFPTLRSHKINVAFIDNSCGIHRREVFVENKEKTIINYDSEGKEFVAVYLNIDEYSFVQTNLDMKSFAFFQANLGSLDDSFLRNMIWKSIYDMVADCKLSSKKFLETVINNLPLENSPATLSDLCGNTREALVTYVPSNYRDEIGNKLFTIIYNILTTKELNIEVSRVLIETLIATARSLENTNLLIQWFESNVPELSTYKLSIYNEWAITKKVLRSEHISEDEKKKIFNAMAEKDKSDDGNKSFVECNVIMADSEERAKVWKDITDMNSKTSLHDLLSKMRGYNLAKHVSFDYLSAYYDILPIVFKKKSFDFARQFADTLIPHASEDFVNLLQMISSVIENADDKSDLALIRKVKEQKDEVEKRMSAYDLFLQESEE